MLYLYINNPLFMKILPHEWTSMSWGSWHIAVSRNSCLKTYMDKVMLSIRPASPWLHNMQHLITVTFSLIYHEHNSARWLVGSQRCFPFMKLQFVVSWAMVPHAFGCLKLTSFCFLELFWPYLSPSLWLLYELVCSSVLYPFLSSTFHYRVIALHVYTKQSCCFLM